MLVGFGGGFFFSPKNATRFCCIRKNRNATERPIINEKVIYTRPI